MLYHVVSATDWTAAAAEPNYEPASLRTDGFIHLSDAHQVAGVLKRYYRNVPNLLLLHIDDRRLTASVTYDVSTNNERFPHLYGPLNRDAVVGVEPLRTVSNTP